MRVSLGLAVALVVGCAIASPVWGHHAHGNYVVEFSDIEGVVKEFHLLNPHSWVYLEVKNAKGEPEIWAVEAAGKGQLERIGVDAKYLKIGDKVKARCHVLKDGSMGCLAGFLKAPDGTVKDWDAGNAEIPKDF